MVRENIIKEIKDFDIKDPIVLEGLPGIGFVGKFVVDQIIKQAEAIKFAELKSDSRKKEITTARQILMLIAKKHFRRTLEKI